MANPELGIDIDWDDDMDPLGRLSEGLDQLVPDLKWRLKERRGGLLDDPDYGFGIDTILHQGMTQRQVVTLPQQIAAELKKDLRVETVSVTLKQEGDVWRVSVEGTSTLGPFDFVLSVGEYAQTLEAQ